MQVLRCPARRAARPLPLVVLGLILAIAGCAAPRPPRPVITPSPAAGVLPSGADSATGAAAQASAARLAPSIAISPATGLPGDTITITGAGWQPGERLSLRLGDPERNGAPLALYPLATAGPQGTFSTTATLPGVDLWPGLAGLQIDVVSNHSGTAAPPETFVFAQTQPAGAQPNAALGEAAPPAAAALPAAAPATVEPAPAAALEPTAAPAEPQALAAAMGLTATVTLSDTSALSDTLALTTATVTDTVTDTLALDAGSSSYDWQTSVPYDWPTDTPIDVSTDVPTGTPAPEPTLTGTLTPTATTTLTPAPDATATATLTPAAAFTPSATVTATLTPNATVAAQSTATITGTLTPSATPTITASPGATPTAGATPSPEPAISATPTPGADRPAPTGTPTASPVPTPTPGPTPAQAEGQTGAPMRINELLTRPGRGRGERPDAGPARGPDGARGGTGQWVELAASAVQPLDIGGWVLDAGTEGDRYAFPAGTQVASGGYPLVLPGLSGFRLPAAGGTLSLLRPDGSVVDRVTYPALSRGSSYSRDDAGAWHTDWPPSPGAANHPGGD